ncbi:hypothetical protein CF15_02515 [Pyrodictium occultum]|uniref:Sjogrens syndrome scleroderma autoantigen 1 n=1 Tax=Pyrodictium occultum TaxID=2309 RepID=A0A0V8RUM8_PYROC|nr:Sjogren's syndrome/scleroderma autoantigen 1 family protein [Pyrodictium occultum]KSW11709.1 hypothetical protein CF15_02515 [Pyrodictium occultum]
MGERASPDVVRRMADLLRAGAAMLPERCPICGLPLFRLRSGEVVCPVHGRVYIVRDESEASKVTVQGVLEELEKFVAYRLSEAMRRAEAGQEPAAIDEIRGWLDVLERVERILGMVSVSLGEERRGEERGPSEPRRRGRR